MDIDIDVVDIITDLPTETDKIGWCRSPAIHPAWNTVCDRLGLGNPEPEANNGLLWLSGVFAEPYDKAMAELSVMKDLPARILGTLAFNLMLRRNPGIGFEIPYKYGCIWWDCKKWPDARVFHYCNAIGQKKREELEQLYLASIT